MLDTSVKETIDTGLANKADLKNSKTDRKFSPTAVKVHIKEITQCWAGIHTNQSCLELGL